MSEFSGISAAIKAIDGDIARAYESKKEVREELYKMEQIQKNLKKKIKYLLIAKRHLTDLSQGLD